MPVSFPSDPTRRALFTWLAAAAITGPTAHANARGYSQRGGRDPMDNVPRYFSIRRFTSLSQPEIYTIDHAIRHGRRITIQGFTPSETRKIVRQALQDWPKTRDSLRTSLN